MEEDSNASNSNSDAEATPAVAPKKISLMVPSLFIKSSKKETPQPTSIQEDSDNEPKKVNRPMPASMRKNQEEKKQPEDDYRSNDHDELPSASDISDDDFNDEPVHSKPVEPNNGSSPKKKVGRPMPASARKKLEVSEPKDESSHASANGEEEENEVMNDAAETPKNGLNEESEENGDHSPSRKKISKPRPMPASARKIVNDPSSIEETVGAIDPTETSSFSTDSKEDNNHHKTKKPGPASRRKILESSPSKGDEGESEHGNRDAGASINQHDDKEETFNSSKSAESHVEISASNAVVKENNHNKPRKPGPASRRKILESSPSKGDEGESEHGNRDADASINDDNDDREEAFNSSKPAESDAESSSSRVHLKENDHKKPRKPGPASRRKILDKSSPSKRDEAESELGNREADISINDDNDNQEEIFNSSKPASVKERFENAEANVSSADLKEDTQKKPRKPGPASRRSLLEKSSPSKANNETETGNADASINDDEEDKEEAFSPKHGSAKATSEKSVSEGGHMDVDVSIEKDEDQSFDLDRANSPTKSDKSPKKKKPMPASAKKKLETTKDDDDNSGLQAMSEHRSNQSETDSPKKIKRPMPASLRRKMEETAKNNNDTAHSRERDEKDDQTDTRSIQRSMPASPMEKSEEDDEDSKEGSSVATEKSYSGENPEEAKKINISLGGIKFPSFKKPMPASAQKKLKEKKKEKQNDENDEKQDEEMDIDSSNNRDRQDGEEELGSTRRGRSSVSNKELQSLSDPLFRCQYCDYESYSESQKNKHEKGHFKVKEDRAPDDESNKDKTQKPKMTKKNTKKEGKYKDRCPHCNKRINNRRKLSKHAADCGRRLKLKCTICSKQLKTEADFRNHNERFHSDNQSESLNTSMQNDDEGEMDHDGSPPASPSHSSEKSKSSEGTKNDRKTKAENKPEVKKTKNVDSFKQKIADVLAKLETKRQKRKLTVEEVFSDEEESPPRKKIIQSEMGEENNESIQGLAMPASVRKKLEDRDKEDPKASSEMRLENSDIHDLECEVCHRVFTQLSNRQRHEKNVHSIQNPRGLTATPTQGTEGTSTSAKKKEPKAVKSKDALTLEDLPKRGKCPICFKFIAQDLKRHAKNVHKMPSKNDNTSSVPAVVTAKKRTTSVAKPSSVLESYRIYKAAAEKAMKEQSTQPPSVPEEPSNSVDTDEHSSEEETTSKNQKEVLKPGAKENKLKKPLSSSAPSTEIKCACCDEIFTVKIDFNEHMTKRHPKMKRLIACKLCQHMFTHEEDFILHVQFRHQELVSGMVKQNQPSSKLGGTTTTTRPPSSNSSSKNLTHAGKQMKSLAKTVTSTSRRNLRGANSIDEEDFNVAAAESCPKVTVDIPEREKLLADEALEQHGNNTSSKSHKSNHKGSKKNSSKSRALASDPEPMDTHYDDDGPAPASPAGMEVEESPTVSKRRSTRNAALASTKDDDDGVNKMPCSACSEVFHSIEALRKHELYFHNMKASKMCPICGVYPTKLSRHLLAHEYKTVKRACAPCHLSFANFGLLLKHNLEHHPGPDGGAQTASNKSAEKEVENQAEEIFKCKICEKEISGGSHARRHVRRFHGEQEDPEKHLEQVGEREEEEDMDIDNVLEDTTEKPFDPEWDDDENNEETPASVSNPGKAQNAEAAESKKPKRPMPASLLAKLKAKKPETEGDDKKSDDTSQAKPVKRAMPASMRGKLEGKKADESSDSTLMAKPKPKMMPASMRAKLMAKGQQGPSSITSGSSEKPKPKMMPASMRAKLLSQSGKDPSSGGSDTSKPSTSNEKPKLKGPASMRAKLASQAQKGPPSIVSLSSKASVSNEKPKLRGPASMRAKLAPQSQKGPSSVISSTSKVSASTEMPKPKRPMPASMRAKVTPQKSSASPSISSKISVVSSSQDKPKPRGPASIRAKMMNKAQLKEVAPELPAPPPVPMDLDDDGINKTAQIERWRNDTAKSLELVTLEEDSNDLAGSSTFNIADEIAEHNKVVVTDDGASTSRTAANKSKNVMCTYKCKLCERAFDSDDDVRRHIQQEHEEYGPDHTENLIGTSYQETVSDVNRRRRSNVNYNKSYRLDEEEDAEQEVIVTRGTSTRPQRSTVGLDSSFSQYADSASSPAISHSVEKTDGNLLYACKFCGKRMDGQGNVRRHISKAHPTMKGLYEDEVVLLEPGREHEFVPMLNENSQQQIIPPVVPATAASQVDTQPPVTPDELPPPPQVVAAAKGFKCKICQKSMDKRFSVMQHINRTHPEVKARGDDVSNFIQDASEKNSESTASTELESSSGTVGEGYKCSFCSFQTTDEPEYVRHYKNHTGVTPYHCQYCSATFNRQQHLTAHITREHTGAEFLNEDEAEISMEEMVGVGEISVSTASRIQIDHPKVITLNRTFLSDNTTPAGPSSGNSQGDHADQEETSEDHPTADPFGPDPINNGDDDADGTNNQGTDEMETAIHDDNGQNDAATSNDGGNENLPEQPEPEPEETETFPMQYQGDLSSLFPTLGGTQAPGGLADIDGGMDLD